MSATLRRMKRALFSILLLAACGTNEANSVEAARTTYLSLDASIDKAINLGFDGFNSASSANISPQTAAGTSTGTLTVTGQVDQGSSANKGMRLFTAYATYSDDGRPAHRQRARLAHQADGEPRHLGEAPAAGRAHQRARARQERRCAPLDHAGAVR